MPVWPDPVSVACERPYGDGVCGSIRLRVCGSWNSPAVIICRRAGAVTGTAATRSWLVPPRLCLGQKLERHEDVEAVTSLLS